MKLCVKIMNKAVGKVVIFFQNCKYSMFLDAEIISQKYSRMEK